jgi:hypothetical protein
MPIVVMPAYPAFLLLLFICTIFNGHGFEQVMQGSRFLGLARQHIVKITIAAGLAVPLSSLALEIQYKLPPIDFQDKNRCELVSSSIGQANAARDKLYDLRQVLHVSLSYVIPKLIRLVYSVI